MAAAESPVKHDLDNLTDVNIGDMADANVLAASSIGKSSRAFLNVVLIYMFLIYLIKLLFVFC